MKPRPITLSIAGALLLGACLGNLQFVRGAGAFCDLDTPCVDDHYCDLEVFKCTPKGELAAECRADSACLSGFCADGVCCESACTEPCLICDAPGSEGTCLAAEPGTNPHGDCPGTTQCGEDRTCQATPVWSSPFGEGKDQTAAALALGPDGQIAIAGGFRGTVVFDKPLQNITPTRQAFVATLDADGNPDWSIQLGVGVHEATAVTIDEDGAVYAVGNFEGLTMDVEPGWTLSGGTGQNIFAMKLVAGSVEWAVAYGANGNQQALDVAVQDGLLMVVGKASGITTFGTCGPHGATTSSGMMLLALDASTGGCLTASVAGNAHTAAAVEPLEGEFLVAGFGQGPVTIAGTALSPGPDDDVILARVAADLTTASWAVTFNGDGDDNLAALAVADGIVWAAGSLQGNLTLTSDESAMSIDDRDALVLRVDASTGDPYDATTFGGLYNQEALAIAVDGSVAVVGGRFEISLDDVSGRGGFDAFVARLDETDLAWSLPIGGRMHDAMRGVALDPEGDLVIVGDFQEAIVLGGEEIASKGDSDIILAKLRP